MLGMNSKRHNNISCWQLPPLGPIVFHSTDSTDRSSVMPSQTNWQERPAETPSCSGPPPERTNSPNSAPGDCYPTPGNDATNQGVAVPNENPKKKKTKANIKINTLNLNGAAAPSENMSFYEKWNRISQMIQSEKIAILAVQETHLDQNMINQLIRKTQPPLKTSYVLLKPLFSS